MQDITSSLKLGVEVIKQINSSTTEAIVSEARLHARLQNSKMETKTVLPKTHFYARIASWWCAYVSSHRFGQL